jgi:transcriptional regulator with XRE-family HTH domain
MPKHHDYLFLAEIGRRLTAKRQDMGFSQQAVADASGLTPQMLSRYEMGLADPPLSTLIRITAALQMSPMALLMQAAVLSEQD